MAHRSYEQFFADEQAIMMNLFLIGETATKIAERFPSLASAHPEIPRRSMRGLCNRIAHDYFDLDFNAIWTTVTSELPALLKQISAITEQQS